MPSNAAKTFAIRNFLSGQPFLTPYFRNIPKRPHW